MQRTSSAANSSGHSSAVVDDPFAVRVTHCLGSRFAWSSGPRRQILWSGLLLTATIMMRSKKFALLQP